MERCRPGGARRKQGSAVSSGLKIDALPVGGTCGAWQRGGPGKRSTWSCIARPYADLVRRSETSMHAVLDEPPRLLGSCSTGPSQARSDQESRIRVQWPSATSSAVEPWPAVGGGLHPMPRGAEGVPDVGAVPERLEHATQNCFG